MKCSYGDDIEKIFSKVGEPYTCCDPLFTIKDDKDKLKYTLTTECCQMGLICKGSYGRFSSVKFGIYSGDKEDFSENNKDGTLIKHGRNLTGFISDADTFEVDFPQDATPDDKLSLISSALMIDYLMFEDGR